MAETLKFKTVEEIEFWKQVFVAFARNEDWGATKPREVADGAVLSLRKRYGDSPNIAELDYK